MKNNKTMLSLAVAAVSMGITALASAEITLYDKQGTTFSADGHFNAFFVQTETDLTDATIAANTATNTALGNNALPVGDEKQSRVRMGFLPNWIGFNVTKEIDTLKLGGRSSFWVTINDGHNSVTDTAIDVRQFYGTVDGSFGQVLFGKDFGLYGRTNIFNDELLLGTGTPMPNTGGVTFGNISTGYPYATPVAQITYRTPVKNGFQLALGVMDPDSGESVESNQNQSARFEGELTYNTDFEGGKFSAWLGMASGESATEGVDATGVAYGARVSSGGFQLTASGFDQEGISPVLADSTLSAETDSDGYLLQASYSANGHRFVVSHGETETGSANAIQERETNAIAYFYDVNSNLKLIAEYDAFEDESGNAIDQLAFGAALSW
ncbi:porin [Motiliproteus sp. MSK22-1]|uniref:porin n=1 Tax=Motiliproteus sp. MSK22-1 TaxID=1897630 RepID=UPI0009758DBB|nr:porin [Motiliproteus sp. MSK22-1]OMH32645.1 hypothetical protein BGP75_13945 [Motiliproteus sp. MSK22-1]